MMYKIIRFNTLKILTVPKCELLKLLLFCHFYYFYLEGGLRAFDCNGL